MMGWDNYDTIVGFEGMSIQGSQNERETKQMMLLRALTIEREAEPGPPRSCRSNRQHRLHTCAMAQRKSSMHSNPGLADEIRSTERGPLRPKRSSDLLPQPPPRQQAHPPGTGTQQVAPQRGSGVSGGEFKES